MLGRFLIVFAKISKSIPSKIYSKSLNSIYISNAFVKLIIVKGDFF